ncbi:MAG: hypothetical protein AAGD05_10310 [Bacteroidota bacterium]
MKKYLFLLTLVWALAFTAQAQLDSILLANSKFIDVGYYPDHQFSPYYFKDWVRATIIGTSQGRVDSVLLNYNGYTRRFELKLGEFYLELNHRYFVRVVVDTAGNNLNSALGDRVVFQRGLHPKFSKEFLVLNYTGRNAFLLSQFVCGTQKSERLDITAGIIQEIRRYAPKTNYFILRDGELKAIKFKKKSLLKALGGYKKELSAFLKANNNPLETEMDVHQLMIYYDQIAE